MPSKRIKMLFITKDWSKGIERNPYHLQVALAELVDLTVWHEAGDLTEILAALPEQPDFILLNDMRPTRCPEITELHRSPVPVGIIMHDLHYRVEMRKKFIEKNNIRYLFTHYRDTFKELFPEYTERMIWFPHFVHTGTYKDYRLPKKYDFLMMGATAERVYPMRQTYLDTFADDPRFTYIKHPGYHHGTYDEKVLTVGSTYAKEINSAKIFLTCDSVFHYPIMKYFEVPACKTLLLATASKEILDLGFIPDVHFVAVTEEDCFEKAEYYLAHYDTLGVEIAQRGYDLVRANHTETIRAHELVETVTTIVQKEGVR